jgi:hypothetical protein
MSFWNKHVGKFYPQDERKKLWMEFSGLTVRQWCFIPFRVVFIFPLMVLKFIFDYMSEYLDISIDYLLETLK